MEYYCNVYINERSAMGQNASVRAVEDAVRKVVDCLSLLDGCDRSVVTIQKFYCGHLFTASLSDGQSVQNLPDKDLKRLFRLALKDAKNWDGDPQSAPGATYRHQGVDVSWSSMSEAYERQFPMLVNFVSSSVQEPKADVEKVGVGVVSVVSIDSYSDSWAVSAWLVEKGWRRRAYGLTSTVPPRDEETILTDAVKFEPTEHRYQGRVMYRRIGTNHLCYVDNKHYGLASHIEEFDEATQKQVAKLKIDDDEVFKPLTKKERERRLRFDGE